MTLYIDADGCPVARCAVELARKYRVPCVLVCDTAHEIRIPGAETVTVSKGADSADFALVNRVEAGDLVITQDYGLAAMCLSRRAIPVHQDGMVYTEENIDGLLFFRAAAGKIRRSGGRLRGPAKRTARQDQDFSACLERLLQEAAL